MSYKRPTTKEERDQRDQERTEKLEQLHGRLADQVAALTTSDDWHRMLTMASRMRQYSLNNVLLILAQRPDATQVAGYRAWQTLGYEVRRGETGLSILAPMTYRTRADDPDESEPTVLRLAGFSRRDRVRHQPVRRSRPRPTCGRSCSRATRRRTCGTTSPTASATPATV